MYFNVKFGETKTCIFNNVLQVLIRATNEQKVLGAMGEVSMVIDPETQQPISLEEARRKRILDETAGLYRDPRTGDCCHMMIFKMKQRLEKGDLLTGFMRLCANFDFEFGYHTVKFS